MGILSFQLREPTVTSRIGFSFLSIILLASGAILGPFGAWFVGIVSVVIDRDRKCPGSRPVFNVAMTASSAPPEGGPTSVERVGGLATLSGPDDVATSRWGSGCRSSPTSCSASPTRCCSPASSTSTAACPSSSSCAGSSHVGRRLRRLRRHRFPLRHPLVPGRPGAVQRPPRPRPLLAARWAFIQYGDELRSHERTVDTLVTALGTKDPLAVERSRGSPGWPSGSRRRWGSARTRSAPCGMRPRCTRSALGVPTRLLRRATRARPSRARRRRPALRHRGPDDRGHRLPRGGPLRHPSPGRALRRQREPRRARGPAIPSSARVVAVVAAVEDISDARGEVRCRDRQGSWSSRATSGTRYDPAVVDALRAALDKHGRQTAVDRRSGSG